jgi:hypothetical protein
MTRIKANPFAISGAVIVLLGLYFFSQWHTHTVQITHPGPATHPGHPPLPPIPSPFTPITPPNPPLQEDTGVDTGDVGVVGFDAGEERGRVALVTGLTRPVFFRVLMGGIIKFGKIVKHTHDFMVHNPLELRQNLLFLFCVCAEVKDTGIY